MCGIVGVIGKHGAAAEEVYESLISLQHRGQDAAGICTYNERFHLKKDLGLVRDVFQQLDMNELLGGVGIGQVRYSTLGAISPENAQPFLTTAPYGVALAHNGNIFNAPQLKQELFEKEYRYINSTNDAEVILNIFAFELSRFCHREFFDSVTLALKGTYARLQGAYSAVAVIAGRGLLAFRDPHGIRPLVWGRREVNGQWEHIFASENTMFEFLGYEFYRDVAPGEAVFVTLDGDVHTAMIEQKEFRPCVFEYVYFARPDAFLNGVSVHRARLRMGQNLAHKIKRLHPKLEIDVVIPAPQTANTAALACAHELGVRYTEGLVKNNFIGRTFIMPEQGMRRRANRYKLSAIELEIKGHNVLVVDDSIVRGNVSRHIVALLRRHGAKQVYFSSTSPVLRWPDLYGIDLPTRAEYVSYQRTEEEIRAYIGADLLIYQDLPDLVEAITRRGDVQFQRVHAAMFDGDYATGDVTEEVLQVVEGYRVKQRQKHQFRSAFINHEPDSLTG
ncbi:MAG: amidophosphoribosyltransferase [Candidatus Veblenbacteria bacterium]|nr:amidophosphoribosyltransferase [Candidatus Veblenbacteria bacterium]